MKEGIFILFIALILFGFTVVRFRKQIAGIIGFARMLKDAKDMAAKPQAIRSRQPQGSVQLVHCSQCNVWVPQSKAVKLRNDGFRCSECGSTT